MTQPPVSLTRFSPDARGRLKALTAAPAIAWPTVILWLTVSLIVVVSDVMAVAELIPLWAGLLLNSGAGYLAFSVVHDGIHRAISSNQRVNDAIGQAAVTLFVPYVGLKLFRWSHILHHRYANGHRDPDIVLHGAWWTLPFRWMFIDGFYLIHVIKHGDKVSKPYLRESLWLAAGTAVAFSALVYFGYGLELLMLWFLPSRLMYLTLGFTFFWLPHVPHDTQQEENFTRATTVRLGHEWLLSPLLQCQNFHLVHHLYPMTPFYNNDKVWHLIEPELRKKDLAIQHGFAIRPTIHLALQAEAQVPLP